MRGTSVSAQNSCGATQTASNTLSMDDSSGGHPMMDGEAQGPSTASAPVIDDAHQAQQLPLHLAANLQVFERLGSSAAVAMDELPRHRPRVLLGVSGSVAAIRVGQLAHLLCNYAEVKVVATTAARHFLKDADFPKACLPIHGDEEEWHQWQVVGDPVLHIELRKWADLLLVAPLSANTLAKMAQGLCDNCLTSVVRAWDFHKPMLVAPAMNTFMWDSPFTSQHLQALVQLGAAIIPPISKKLACGDVGNGAMATPEDIAARVHEALTL
jgi:phosphopantothenoylcysteine decarboxylase